MKNFKFLISIIFILLFGGLVLAQDATIKGKIFEGNRPLPFANVAVSGTNKGTDTDFDGNFIIKNLQSGEITIEASFIGYETKKMTINLQPGETKDVGIIILNPLSQQLNEVVVTALGIKKAEKALGYAVSSLKPAELNEAKEVNLLNSLNGKIAGVQITNGSSGVGSTSRVVIRGESSLTLRNNNPLFVVDGVPISDATILSNTENSGSSGEMQEVDWGNGAAEINAADVESMSVLKGASAAALYGSRGANGVILINTKTAKRNKGLSLSVNTGVTLESVLRLPQYQNKYGQGWAGEFEYIDGLNNSLGLNDQEDTSWGPLTDGRLITQFDSPASNGLRAGDIFARGWVRNADGTITSPNVAPNDLTATPFVARPNNIKDFFRTGFTSTFGVSAGFGSDKSDFLFSFGYLNSEGIIPNTDIARKSYRVNGSIDVTEKLTLTVNGNYINSESNNRPSSGYGSESAMYMFTWYGRQVNTNALKEYWQRGFEGVEQFNYNYAWHDNPYFMLNENTNAFDKHRILGNIRANYNFTDNLTLQVRTGADYYTNKRVSKRAYSTQRFLKGALREEHTSFKEINTDFLLTYNKDLNDSWNLTSNIGGNQMMQETNYLQNFADGLIVPNLYSLNNGVLLRKPDQYKEQKEINSLYGTLGLSFENKIFLDVTARNDWSSTLPKNNNSYFYPSASLSTIISDMVELPEAFNFFKLRGSWAKIGSDTSPYNLKTPYNYQLPYNNTNTLTRDAVLRNENLKPEMTTAFEVGADLRMFGNRVMLDIAYYNSTSADQIMSVPVSASSSFTSQIINAGKIRNQGIEALLTLKPIKNEDFSWTSSFNFTTNRGKVLELPESVNGVLTLGYASVYNAESSKVFIQAREGEALGNMYGRVFKRHNGKIIYENGLPVVDSELQLLGNYNPDFSLGFKNDFSYKNFDFSFLVDWKQGGTLISRTKQIAAYAGNLDVSADRNNYQDIVPDGVKEVNGQYVPLTEADAIGWWKYFKPLYDRRNQQETGITSATYVKLREVKLGYTMPNSIAKKFGLETMKISLVGRNLALWTPSSNQHFDPETLALQGRNIIPGIEDVSYPSSRSYGINFLFNF